MAKFDLNDLGVVVIIGSGAGGGTLGNELAQKGVKVVILEAGGRYEIQDFINDEWDSFTQLAWKDMRTTSGSWRVSKDFPNLPAWIVKAVGGSTVHWAGASLRIDQHEFKARTTYGAVPGANSDGLARHAGRDGTLVRQGRVQDGRDPDQRHSRAARQQQFQGARGRRPEARLQDGAHRQHGDQFRAARRPRILPTNRLLLPGLQIGRQMVDAVHRNPEGRGDRQSRGPAQQHGDQSRA